MKKLAYLGAAFALPLVSLAQTVNSIQTLGTTVINIINGTLVPIVFAIAFIVFIWGVFQFFIFGGHNDEAREKGKNLMLWGLIGFFLMVSVWGLVSILTGTFQLNNQAPSGSQLPDAPRTN